METSIKEEPTQNANFEDSDTFSKLYEAVKEEPIYDNFLTGDSIKIEEHDLEELTQGDFKVEKDEPETAPLESCVSTNPGERPFKCIVCEFTFLKQTHLEKHLVIHKTKHRAINGFKCTICDVIFKRKFNLKAHLLIHSGKRLSKCIACDCASSNKVDLKKGALVGTKKGKRQCKMPFRCSVCDYTCFQEQHLKSHSLIHITVNSLFNRTY